ncbi:MAG: rhomboid family intramembrane serine protease [Anaerolineae bacterium]|jgi:rhomboid protease GluP|nr:rhomboid family intramembrane serine protease [Chloroflexota bacterium]
MSDATAQESGTVQPPGQQSAVRYVQLTVPRHRPVWTYVLLTINVLVFALMTVLGGSENPAVLVLFGAKYQPLIAQGQYWRLLTANFIHIGLLHLAMNLYALYVFGLQVERRFGRARFILLYLLSGIAGTALSYVGSRALSAGASAAIFGLIGAITAYYVIHRRMFGTVGYRQLRGLLIVMGINLVMGLTSPQIDNLGHLGGLLAGSALGWAYCPRYAVARGMEGLPELQERKQGARPAATTVGMVAVLVALSLLGTWLHTGAAH